MILTIAAEIPRSVAQEIPVGDRPNGWMLRDMSADYGFQYNTALARYELMVPVQGQHPLEVVGDIVVPPHVFSTTRWQIGIAGQPGDPVIP